MCWLPDTSWSHDLKHRYLRSNTLCSCLVPQELKIALKQNLECSHSSLILEANSRIINKFFLASLGFEQVVRHSTQHTTEIVIVIFHYFGNFLIVQVIVDNEFIDLAVAPTVSISTKHIQALINHLASKSNSPTCGFRSRWTKPAKDKYHRLIELMSR